MRRLPGWWLPALAALGFWLTVGAPARAAPDSPGMFRFPESDIALGPAAAFVHGPGSGWALNFDTAYCEGLVAGSLNLKFAHQPGYTLYGAQAEVTVWVIANLGGGAGYLSGTDHGPVFHLFAGLPYGDAHAFVEPYYRLNFFVPDELQLIHEIGVMVKYTTFGI